MDKLEDWICLYNIEHPVVDKYKNAPICRDWSNYYPRPKFSKKALEKTDISKYSIGNPLVPSKRD